MSVDRDVAEILEGFVPVGRGAVPADFRDFVHDQIAARPSPTPPVDPLVEVNRKLDRIIELLEGGTP